MLVSPHICPVVFADCILQEWNLPSKFADRAVDTL